MHELSVCQSIIDQVNHIAADHQASSVDKIYLQIGPLAGIEPELLLSAFSIAKAATVASHAELIIQTTPVRVKCEKCSAISEVVLNHLVCQSCGDWRTQLLSGDELLLERVELHKQH